ncbi:MAG: cell division protein ZapA [Chitinophagaceae bacterium]
MSEEKLIPVSVTIADRSYRVRVETHEEQSLRKTVKLINQKVLEFKSTLAGKDMQDYIAMAILWFATQPVGEVNNIMQQQELTSELERISRLLDKVVS